MKGNLIGPDNQKFEADIVRYFQNVNDKYLIYSKGEKDGNGFILLYVTKVLSDNGIKIGENVTDENEWSLIKNFLKQTVNENKENKPLTIVDVNPIEVNDLKINASRPFKLQENVVELFGKNKKSFEIVQQMLDRQNTAIPVAPEVTEFVKPDSTVNMPVEPPIVPQQPVEPPAPIQNAEIKTEELPKVEPTVEPSVELPTTEPVTEVKEVMPTVEPKVETTIEPSSNYEELYNKEVEKNNELTKEMEQLVKDNAELKSKMDKLKELLS